MKIPPPWNPGFALPSWVSVEAPGRGAHRTKYMPRRTVDTLVPREITKAWRPGFAYPDHVLLEGPATERVNARRTKYMPRRTIDTGVLDYLGDDEGGLGPASDPVGDFGKTVASYIMKAIQQVPQSERKAAMKALFDEVDPKLWVRVSQKANQLRMQGATAAAALRGGIASAMSQGLVEDFVKAGRSGKSPQLKSLMGLGCYGAEAEQAVLEGFWSRVKSVVTAPARAVTATGKGIYSGAKRIGSAVRSGASAAYDFGKKALSKIANAACRVASHPTGQVAVGAGAGALGAPPQAGMAGAQIGAALCASDPPPPPQMPVAQPAGGLPIVPIAIAGGAVALAFILTRK
ncbi:MAG: hypothetical protein R3322_00355 [Kiloniellales bacterium]|nr:hypothetical protein [Kiloniellales bacterium]